MLADTPERMEWLKMAHARALSRPRDGVERRRGEKSDAADRGEIFVGAMLDAADGNLDPSGTTHAYAKSARLNGAEIFLNNRSSSSSREAMAAGM